MHNKYIVVQMQGSKLARSAEKLLSYINATFKDAVEESELISNTKDKFILRIALLPHDPPIRSEHGLLLGSVTSIQQLILGFVTGYLNFLYYGKRSFTVRCYERLTT